MGVNAEVIKKIEEFFGKYKIQRYKKNEILIRAGDEPPGIFYLRKGRVREYAISKKGEEIVVNIFKPGSFFPMSWAINGTHNMYFFEAMESLELFRAPRDESVIFLKQNSDVLYDLLSRTYLGTDGMLMKLAHLMFGRAEERLVSELVILAERFGKRSGNRVTISTTERDLSAETGMTRETISREIKKLTSQGHVSYAHKVLEIRDIELLKKLLEQEY